MDEYVVVTKKEISIWEFSPFLEKELEITAVRYIGKHAFADSTVLETVLIVGDNNTFLDIGCFSYCIYLKKLVIEKVRVLGMAAFSWCTSLKEVFLDVEIVGEGSFYHCSNLEKVTFSPKVKLIEDRAFSACFNLVNVVFEGEKPVMGEFCFYHTGIFEDE